MANSESKPAVIAALIGNCLIAVTKFIAAFFTGSAAMISEGIHSLVDVGNQVLLLFGLHQANKEASAEHPFGYGREIYFWSFIVAIVLFAFGGGMSIYEGFKHLQHPTPINHVMVNYVVLISAFIFESYAFRIAYKTFKKQTKKFHWFRSVNRTKDPALIVVLLEDSAAMIGLVIAFIGISISYYFKLPVIDACASILIGVVLLLVASWLAYESKKLLIGEAATPEMVAVIKQIIDADKRIDDVKNILTMHMSPQEILVNLNVDFKDDLSSQEVEDTIGELEVQIKDKLPEVAWIFIAAKSFSLRRGTA